MAITNINVENDFDNKLLRRREMTVSIEFDGATPSREEIKKSLADKLNLKPENMVVVRAGQLFGTKKGSALVHEYQDKKAMEVAQKHVVSRPNKKKEAAAAPQQQAPAKPAEQKKEEAKAGGEAK